MHHWLYPTLCVVLLCGACQREEVSDAPANERRVPVPNPNTDGTERLVAERIRAARLAVQSQPKSAAAWGKLGMVLDIHDFVADAVVCYQQAERLDPTDFRWPYMTGVCLPNAAPEDRIEAFQRAHQLKPAYAPSTIRLARQLLQADRNDEARQLFASVLDVPMVRSHALLGLARVDMATDQPSAARVHLESAVELNPKHREAHVLIAQVYSSLGETELARTAADAASKLSGKTPLRDPARTEVMFEGATADQLAMQGNRLRARQRYPEAIAKLRLSIEADASNPMAHFDLGLALASLGRWDEGIASLREALRVDPNFEPARQALAAVIAERDKAGF